jgi:hypothetical protein
VERAPIDAVQTRDHHRRQPRVADDQVLGRLVAPFSVSVMRSEAFYPTEEHEAGALLPAAKRDGALRCRRSVAAATRPSAT